MILAALAVASTVIAQSPITARLRMEPSGDMSGIVVNPSNKTLNFIYVSCSVYDINGLIIDAPSGLLPVTALYPQEAARWHRYGSPLGKPDHFRCRIKHRPDLHE
jgi:hypothetical protein